MFKRYHAQVNVPLHTVCALFDEVPFDFKGGFGRFKLILIRHLQSATDHVLVEAHTCAFVPLHDGLVGGGRVEVVACGDGLRADDVGGGTRLERKEVRAKHHLAEAIVVHTLQNSALLGRVLV